MTVWWLVLYYPIMIGLIVIGTRLDKRLAPGSKARNRADLALGCGIILMPALPLMFWVGSIVVDNAGDPLVRLLEIAAVFWIVAGLFYGAFALFYETIFKIIRSVQARLKR